MANLTKKRIIDVKVRELTAGDILTAYQARNIGWVSLRRVGLECVDLPQENTKNRFVKLQPLSVEISGCTAAY
jgi:hypothetical protein